MQTEISVYLVKKKKNIIVREDIYTSFFLKRWLIWWFYIENVDLDGN